MRTLVVLGSAFLLVAPAVARAGGKDPAAAEVLFREGRRAADAGDYATACPKFEESYSLDPAPGTLLSLGDCEENRGQLARAWQHFQRLYDQLPPSDRRKRIAAARARSLELVTPRLRIVLMASVPANVVRDDIPLGSASLGTRLPVDPGRHVVVVTSPGRRDMRYEVSVAAGDDKELSVSTGEPLPRTSFTAPASLHESTTAREGDRRLAAAIVGGAGAALLIPGGILAGVALSQMGQATQIHQAQSMAIAGDVFIGVGVALIGSAIVLLLTSPHAHGARSARAFPLRLEGRF